MPRFVVQLHREIWRFDIEVGCFPIEIASEEEAGNRHALGSTSGIQNGPSWRRRASRVEPAGVSPGAMAQQDLRPLHPAHPPLLFGIGLGPSSMPKWRRPACRSPADTEH